MCAAWFQREQLNLRITYPLLLELVVRLRPPVGMWFSRVAVLVNPWCDCPAACTRWPICCCCTITRSCGSGDEFDPWDVVAITLPLMGNGEEPLRLSELELLALWLVM